MTTQRANDLEHLLQQRRQQVHELESELGKLDEQLGNSKSPASRSRCMMNSSERNF